jgi:hypothetical protein
MNVVMLSIIFALDIQHNNIQHDKKKCDTQHNDRVGLFLLSSMLSIAHKPFLLSAVMLNVFQLSVVMLTIVMLSFLLIETILMFFSVMISLEMLCFFILSVIIVNVVAP